jgi:hypothetical protein
MSRQPIFNSPELLNANKVFVRFPTGDFYTLEQALDVLIKPADGGLNQWVCFRVNRDCTGCSEKDAKTISRLSRCCGTVARVVSSRFWFVLGCVCRASFVDAQL